MCIPHVAVCSPEGGAPTRSSTRSKVWVGCSAPAAAGAIFQVSNPGSQGLCFDCRRRICIHQDFSGGLHEFIGGFGWSGWHQGRSGRSGKLWWSRTKRTPWPSPRGLQGSTWCMASSFHKRNISKQRPVVYLSQREFSHKRKCSYERPGTLLRRACAASHRART